MGQGFWGWLSPGGTGYSCRCGKLNGGFPPAALAIPAAVENSMGAFPRRHRLSLPLWCPRGACLFGCLSPLPLALFLPPIPPTRARRALFPGGEGGDQSCFLQGAPPLASPALDRLRHWLDLPYLPPAGRVLYPAVPALPAVSMLSCPHPPNPLPRRGRGRPKLFHARGSAPCIPSIRPPAALVRPAAVENSMAAFPRRHWLSLPLWCPRGGLAFLVACRPCL